jgi:hypothetical protein
MWSGHSLSTHISLFLSLSQKKEKEKEKDVQERAFSLSESDEIL